MPAVWLSVQVSASVPIAPDAPATGDRSDHKVTWAVWRLFGSAPVTSTTSMSVSAWT